MSLNTTSAVIDFYSKLQDQFAAFYEQLANKKECSFANDTFLSLAKQTRKRKEVVERAYREVISDELEACFLDSNYIIDTDVSEGARSQHILRKAIELEE